jgi:hypothetical protein
MVTTSMIAAVATLKSRTVFTSPIMACVAYVTLPIPRFVRMKVAERLFSALRHRSCVTVMRIVAVIDVAVEAARTMEPWAGSNEKTANEPIRPIVAIRSTVIRGIVEIPIRSHRRRPNANGNLSRCYGYSAH